MFLVCDVSSWEDQVALFGAGFEKYGRIDSVVINAGETLFIPPHFQIQFHHRLLLSLFGCVT
jgi:NAD(P)-dependent dehydrogenase (short-subunit alcohol dehydrogenase family)